MFETDTVLSHSSESVFQTLKPKKGKKGRNEL